MARAKSVEITIREDDNVDRSLKKFKRLCESFGILKEFRNRKEYKKPSIKSKEKREAAEKRRAKTASRMNRYSSKI